MEKERSPESISRGAFVVGSSSSALALRYGAVASAEPQTAPSASPAADGAVAVLNVNGTDHPVPLEPRVTLLDALRDRLGMTGTKKGCDQGTCGACTVLVNGRRIVSCLTLAVMHGGDRITTIEGLARPAGGLHPLQAAFIEHDAFQCGYCTPGQIVSALGMANEGHAYERETVREQMSGNLCRCGCYPHIVDAILAWRGAS